MDGRTKAPPELRETAIVIESRLKKQIHLPNRLMIIAHQKARQRRAD
jgi:hypothetical protein